MATKGFSLADFFPEPMTFTDNEFGGDGKVHDVKTVELLGVQDSVRIQRLYDRLAKAMSGSGKGATEEKLAAELEQAAAEMLYLLIPTLPKERVKKIPFQVQFRFLQWWKQEQKALEKAVEGEGGAAGEATADNDSA